MPSLTILALRRNTADGTFTHCGKPMSALGQKQTCAAHKRRVCTGVVIFLTFLKGLRQQPPQSRQRLQAPKLAPLKLYQGPSQSFAFRPIRSPRRRVTKATEEWIGLRRPQCADSEQARIWSGRSIGSSVGLAPRNTLPARTPTRRYSPRRFGP